MFRVNSHSRPSKSLCGRVTVRAENGFSSSAGRVKRTGFSAVNAWKLPSGRDSMRPVLYSASGSASSASELVTELLQYLVEPTDLLREEAGALLAGIVLDTKHFTQRTGGRTFEAAAFLRRSGADTAEVQRLFQGDLKDMVTKYDIIRRAEMYRSNIAVSVVEEPGVDRVAAAQAADDLLTLKGVQASFVVYAAEGAVLMSARSLGEINVQVILEALGGGGNSTTAGARIEDTDPESVRQQLIGVLDAYFEK